MRWNASPTSAPDPGPLGLLVRDLGHRQIRIVVRDAPTGPGAFLDPGELDDVGELVGHLDQV